MRHFFPSGLALLLMVATGGSITSAAVEANKQMVEEVELGLRQEAKASWWGFNENDATENLQAAIDSGVQRLIIEDMGKPWMVRPLSLRSNQTIIFEDGVVIQAKRGEFRGTRDVLLSLHSVENVSLKGNGATLRMHRDDYDAEPYEHAQWRHVMSIRESANVLVDGLTLAESGGDGIYIGGSINKNIHVKDVVCDRNYRQGISVISADGLLIEDTVLSNTAGTPPQAGIDFEPNSSSQ